MLRIDNGGEYTSRLFSQYCKDQGILRQLTQPHTPQHNGVAERKNRTLLDIVRCSLRDGDLPAHLWAEAVRAACIITNLRSSKSHPDKTPRELFFGIKPSISTLPTFGSLVYVHITKPGCSKLDPRSRPCLHLSYDDQVKGYRCYNPGLRKVIISKDIRFLEKSPPMIFSQPTSITSSISGPTLPQLLPVDISSGNFSPQCDPPPSCVPDTSTEATPTLSYSPISSPRPGSPIDNPDQPNNISTEQSAAPTLRQSTRTRSAPKSHSDFIPFESFIGTIEEGGETLTYAQARLHPEWAQAMISEYKAIMRNHTWQLVPLPAGIRPITSRWIFKLKPSSNGNSALYKARIIACGNEQVHGVISKKLLRPQSDGNPSV
jgi:hypothetical protein